jgi:DNA processing protein
MSVAGRAWNALSVEANWIQAQARARQIIEEAERLQVRILTAFDEDYPALLHRVPESPLVVYVKGCLRKTVRNVACVGTRAPTTFGTEVTRRLVSYLTDHDWGIVSGLARGIDAEAHRTAIERNGYTVAVLGNGLDKVYPLENRHLADEILHRGGALLSEQPFGVAAKAAHLVQRDRLQSGMSIATIVMQTDLSGGTMHTVRFTLTQGRFLVAPVPQGKYAEEAKSRGLLALTGSTGSRVADLFGASDDYRKLLLSQFRDRAPAFPLRSRDDYPELLRRLSELAVRAEEAAVARVPAQLFEPRATPGDENQESVGN